MEFSSNLAAIYEVGRTNFSADFWTFRYILTAISQKLWRNLAKNYI